MSGSREAVERNARIVAFAQANPCVTLEQIGKHYGITKQRVAQILNQAGLFRGQRKAPRWICPECKQPCNKGVKRHMACVPVAWLVCDYCQQQFPRRISAIKQTFAASKRKYKHQRFYCSREHLYADKAFHGEVFRRWRAERAS